MLASDENYASEWFILLLYHADFWCFMKKEVLMKTLAVFLLFKKLFIDFEFFP